jgi:hypothetical protein
MRLKKGPPLRSTSQLSLDLEFCYSLSHSRRGQSHEDAEPVVTAQRDGLAVFCIRQSLIAWLTWCVRQIMKFACPRCKQRGVGSGSYFLDDFRKENRCAVCGAPIVRRHYVSPWIFEMLFGGGILFYVALFFSWMNGSWTWVFASIGGAISMIVIGRLADHSISDLEDAESDTSTRRTKRNQRVARWAAASFGVFALCAIIYVALNE